MLDSLFNKVSGLTQMLSSKYCKIFKNNYFEEHLRTTASVNHKLRCYSDFIIPGINTVYYVGNSIGYFGPLILNNVPSEIRRISDLNRFKVGIRKWKPSDCLCILCKNYLGKVGFINLSWLELIVIYFVLNSLCIYTFHRFFCS